MNRNNATPIIFLSVLVVLVAAISLGVWMRGSIRLDEAQSVWQTSRDLPGMIVVIARDVHTPLYFVMLHFWEVLFGTSVLAIRSLSLVFFLLCIPAMYMLGNLVYGRKAGYVAALLVAVSPFLHWYGSEARMYSLLLFLAIASHYCFIRLWRHPSRGTWLWYTVVALLGSMTHFFFYFVLAAQAAFYFTHRKIFQEGALRRFIESAAVVGLAGAVWFAYRAMVGLGTTSPILARPSSVDLSNIFSNFFIGFQGDLVNTIYLSLWPVLILVGFTFLARRKWAGPETAYFAIASFLPIGLAFLVSITVRPIFLSRYLLVCLPTLYLIVVHFLLSYRRTVSNALVVGVTAIMTVMLFVQAVNPESPVKENYRAAAEYLEANAKAQDLVIVSAPFITYPIEYYYDGPARIATFPRWERYTDVVMPPPYSEELLVEATRDWSEVYRNAYFLFGYDQGYEEDVRIYMDTHYQRIETREFSPGLNLHVYRLRYL